MENQDKLYEQFRDASQKSEAKDFPAMEKVWNRVEEKLDKKEDHKGIVLWKKIAVAASLLLFFSLGYQFLKSDKQVNPKVTPENNVVIQETPPIIAPVEQPAIIQKDAEIILKKQLANPNTVAVSDVNHDEKEIVEEDNSIYELDEIVVEAAPIVRMKKSLGYSSTVVSSESVEISSKGRGGRKEESTQNANAAPNPALLQSLQGRVVGVNMGYASNQPGSSQNIVLRGISSINGNIDPLYVIDDVPANGDALRKLDPNSIESITVLKDASATAIYGSRAINGAIVITSKSGMTSDTISKKEARKLKRQLKKLKKNTGAETVQPIIQQQIEVSQEDYDNFIENPFENPKTAPLSTFSIDVDNASYTNVRRFINNGQTVPKDAVRVEEMVNFFKYQYPQPQDQHPFSINTEYSDCPWNAKHKLLKIGLQGKNIPSNSLPASNLVFLIDVSGSMSDTNKLPLLKQSMKVLVNELREKDKVTIIVYAGAAGMVLPPTSGDEKQIIINALENLDAGGSTAGGAGIDLAYKMAQENFVKGGNNRVILATDGDFNVGASSNTDMETLIEEKRKSGVFLTCLGYGMGNYKDSKMEILADKGNGNYAYIDNIQEANRFLGKEFKGSMFAIAKDVKIQIEFNPKHVQSYRLIGYENRKLRPEDFTNDKIDAGELGSGHTVTALYEVIPTGVKSDYFNETPELKYTKTQQTANDFKDELATVKFRYKKPDGDTSIEMVKTIANQSQPIEKTSYDFRFSAAVAWFGLKLRDSKLIGNKSSEEIIKLAKTGMSDDPEGYKAEFVRLAEAVK
jgi:Ca-activated chloride channel family protein